MVFAAYNAGIGEPLWRMGGVGLALCAVAIGSMVMAAILAVVAGRRVPRGVLVAGLVLPAISCALFALVPSVLVDPGLAGGSLVSPPDAFQAALHLATFTAMIALLILVTPAGVPLMVRRSLRRHAVSTSVTALATALGTGLTISVLVIHTLAHDAFVNVPTGFDAVLGGRGSQVQLVLNSVFHIDEAPGKIPWAVYQDVAKNQRTFDAAVPIAVGDNYYGFRIVGTTPDFMEHWRTSAGTPPQLREYFDSVENRQRRGVVFDEQHYSAVIGSYVAQRTGLKERDVFQPYHGLFFNPDDQHDVDYRVCGVLEPTNSPLDRIILIPLQGMWRMPGHMTASGDEGAQMVEIPDSEKEISAILLRVNRSRNPASAPVLARYSHYYNRQGKVATFAPISAVMEQFLDTFGWLIRVLQAVAMLVLVVAAASILASVYNTMNERRREIAILRALGAGRRTITSAIVLEATAIAALGSGLAIGVHLIVASSVSGLLRQQAGVILDVWRYHPAVSGIPMLMIALGVLAGIVPAIRAYATDVATGLEPHS